LHGSLAGAEFIGEVLGREIRFFDEEPLRRLNHWCIGVLGLSFLLDPKRRQLLLEFFPRLTRSFANLVHNLFEQDVDIVGQGLDFGKKGGCGCSECTML